MPSDSTSDSETYSSPHDASPHDEPPTPRTTLILAQPPTLLSLLRSAAINLLLPFINGLMLGVGELVANEAAFRLGWAGTKVFPSYRAARRAGPGVEVRADPVERRRRSGEEMDMWTSME